MSNSTDRTSYKDVKPYVTTVLISVVGCVLWLADQLIYALLALGLALVSFFNIKALLNRIEKTNRQRRLLEEEFRRAQKLSTVDELSAGIAHEINNPLGIIAQEAQWMQHIIRGSALREVKEAADCDESLREITGQVDRCKEIVNKLLSLARDLEPVIQGVDLNDLIENIAALVEKEVRARNIEVVRDLQADMPFVYTDPPLLRQVILNLLVNATHAIKKDGIIRIASTMDNDCAHITVEDSGCGIPKEDLNRIFTPFFSTKPQGKGAGLGLAICRGIVERLGGYISVSSDVGKCTNFTIHLPIRRPSKGAISHVQSTENTYR